MKRIAFAFVLFTLLAFSASALAQTPATQTNKIAWDQAALSLAEAQGYTYKYYADGAATGTTLLKVTCVGNTPPYQCEVPFPAFTPGPHTLTLTASSAGVESAQSATLAFTFAIVPAIPANPRIK
jgi:hypothetical protein